MCQPACLRVPSHCRYYWQKWWYSFYPFTLSIISWKCDKSPFPTFSLVTYAAYSGYKYNCYWLSSAYILKVQIGYNWTSFWGEMWTLKIITIYSSKRLKYLLMKANYCNPKIQFFLSSVLWILFLIPFIIFEHVHQCSQCVHRKSVHAVLFIPLRSVMRWHNVIMMPW